MLRRGRASYLIPALTAAVIILTAPALAPAADGSGPDRVDELWVLVSAALIFLMQAGFLALEVGFVRPPNASITAMKSVVDWCVGSVLWLLVGFGIAFGPTAGGLAGIGFFGGEGIEPPAGNGLGWTYFLFQMGFLGTAITIVSGGMAERVSFLVYMICTAFNAILIYPVVAHWVWGNGFIVQDTLLASRGFVDFAGSSAVHSVGGWICLVGIWVLGPRLGRFGADGKPRELPITSMPLVALGTLILWFGWWGFNGGSTLAAGASAAKVIARTNVAGAAAAICAYLHAALFQGRRDLEAKFIGGALAGLVAITAGAHVVSSLGAVIVGLIAGIVHNLLFELLIRLRLDDPVGAVPVHLGGGILGTLCVGLLGQAELLPKPRLEQIGVQLMGIAAIGAWTVATSYVLFAVLKATLGMRVAPDLEVSGITLSEITATPPVESISEEEIRRMMS